jgi:hypothetical protein
MVPIRVVCVTCQYERSGPIQQSKGPLEPPRHGDFWLCPRCGEVHRFMITARPAEQAELLELPDRDDLLAVQARIRKGVA